MFKEEENPEIVLKVDMHCEACARKVARTLKGFQGVEHVATDCKANKVVVKGKTADPTKVYQRLLKKYGRKVELVSPPPEPKDDKKEEPPAVIRVVLKIGMHCEACAHVLRKQIRKIKGIESVETDVGNDQVIVKGRVEPTNLVEHIYKRTGKQATIVKDQEKKEQETKKEDEIKPSEYFPSKHYSDLDYPIPIPPQFFSDDNPNACSLM
ncbi:HEAVY METAL ASSOCIATED PROTEIN 52 [Hibiscus trionum]|uniref:HEAVY METAL ASSOCIATED PROTEIN 52 n=1 Tax=Hibiscus trionum TaxID=183268 RepID=A0A9W7MQK2_HIBTR|nr:HEAVY METAL ASSOCIATED PROTEIN 52 [Hibiscus trionum]